MAARFKIFGLIVMILSAVGLSFPETVCASDPSPAAKSGCCSGGMVCKCHPDKAGSTSCKVTRLPSGDKSIPARSALAPSSRVDVPLFTMASISRGDWVSQPLFHGLKLNASPPFGGSPPQAVLRLWRI
ncbi:MAG: hypothetical protein LV480_12995 [Methylacidiphilales bacterium]|nr:hypothetical protein [Candidatus Methylacidiphilales bacterium]